MTKLTEKSETSKKQLSEKRSLLCQITAQARTLREDKMNSAKTIEETSYWGAKPLNFYITNYIYQDSAKTLIFKTFGEWKKEGATIIKGSKAFVIWGQPLKKQKKNQEQVTPKADEVDNLDFFPLCYVFSSAQVHLKSDTVDIPEERVKEDIADKAPLMDIDSYLN